MFLAVVLLQNRCCVGLCFQLYAGLAAPFDTLRQAQSDNCCCQAEPGEAFLIQLETQPLRYTLRRSVILINRSHTP